MMRDSRRRSPESSRRRRREPTDSHDRQPDLKYTKPITTGLAANYYNAASNASNASNDISNNTTNNIGTTANNSNTMPPYAHHQQAPPPPRPQPAPLQRPRTSSSSGSSSGSSTSSSLLDISRRYPEKQRFGGIFTSFFRAPSEHRRQPRRRRKSASKKKRILYFGNSSSSSVNSDMAYGHGYIKRKRSRTFSPPNDPRAQSRRDGRGAAPRPSSPRRSKTDEEILALGRQLSDMARRSNDDDLRRIGKSRPSGLVSAASGISEFRRHRKGDKARGIGSSKTHDGSSSDDAEWESASEDESSSDDSNMAYGSVVSHALKPAMTAAAGAAAGYALASATHRSSSSSSDSDKPRHQKGQSRSGVVDPKLFGPVNSLRGIVNTPCGFSDDQNIASSSRQRREGALKRSSTEPMQSAAAMRNVYPVPTSDPNRFDVNRSSTTSRLTDPTSDRPAPVPLQQPVPKAPVSSKVYDAEKLEDAERDSKRHSRHQSDDHSGWGGAAAAAIAAGAAGAVATHFIDEKKSEDRREDREAREGERHDRDKRSERSEKRDKDSKRRDRESERDRDRDREKDRDRERRKSKRDSYSSKYEDRKDHKRHSRSDTVEETPRKRRETDKVAYKRDGGDIRVEYEPDIRSELSRQSRRDSRKYEKSRDLPQDSSIVGYQDTLAGKQPASAADIDPFQYQVVDDALSTHKDASGAERPLTPNIVTVDRVPSFDASPPREDYSDRRLSRKESFEIEQQAASRKADASKQRTSSEDRGRKHAAEDRDGSSQSMYDVAKKATVPIAAAAVASAIYVEEERSKERRRRRDEYSDDGSQERTRPSKDAVQEDADRYYRESVIARKIASEQVRSSSRERNQSVINKYPDEQADPPAIVTPPGMDKDAMRRYDAPDADVRIDNRFFPKDEHTYRRSLDLGYEAAPFNTRDPECDRDRPMLNLVFPTPVSSRHNTPSPDKHAEQKSREAHDTSSKSREPIDVVLGPKGEVVQAVSSPKSVTWGENKTEVYDVVTPEHKSEAEIEKDHSAAAQKSSRPRLNKSSQWGMIASAIAGSSTEPANEPDVDDGSTRDRGSSPPDGKTKPSDSATTEDRDLERKSSSPPAAEHMPGGFDDDIEFAATLAAGLKDTGFDPNIVIDDPTYRRRDSPPGSNGEEDAAKSHYASFVDVVADASAAADPARSQLPEQGFVEGEVETPKDETAPKVEDEWDQVPVKLSKKEKRRLEKEAKRQSMEVDEAAAADTLNEPVQAETPTDPAPEEIPEVPVKLSKKEQKKRDKAAKLQALIQQDEEPAIVAEPEPLATSEPPQDPEAAEDEWQPLSKKKSKKNRKSRDWGDDDESSKVTVPIDAFDELQPSKEADANDEWAPTPKKSKKKSKRSSASYDSPSQSAAASEVGDDTSSKRSSKSKHRSGADDDFYEYGDGPPDLRSDLFEDREVSSVVSESRRDDGKRERRHHRRSSSRYDDDDVKSVASAPGASRNKSRDPERRSSGGLFGIFKSNGHKEDDKKQSFLGNAGTLGAGVGLAGAAVAVAADLSRSNAAEGSSDMEPEQPSEPKERGADFDSIDPEIAPRAIKPAIDPQYGDLLPLPPSEPGSPVQSPEELPGLPDSRPDTPPEERNIKRERLTHHRRRSTQETPVKSPSHTAIPISLRLGQRSSPSTPSGAFKSSPAASPVINTPEGGTLTRRPSRPTSWDNSREIKPLYLVEHSRQGTADPSLSGSDLPPLPASDPSSREASEVGVDQLGDDVFGHTEAHNTGQQLDRGLRIDTGLAAGPEVAGSQETTPKAETKPELPILLSNESWSEAPGEHEPEPIDPMSKNRSSYLLNSTPSTNRSNKTADADSFNQSPPGTTPSKQHGRQDLLLPNIVEDLTSADEHFSDALEGQSDLDTFEDTRDWPSATPSEADLSNERTPVLTATAAPVSEDPAPEEGGEGWSLMTAKEKKKAKKARKNKSLQLDDPAPAEIPDSGPAPFEPSESLKDPIVGPQDEFVEPKKGKKGKKNKKKTTSWEDDFGGAAPSQPANDTGLLSEDAKAADAEVAETADPTAAKKINLDDTDNTPAPFASVDVSLLPAEDTSKADDAAAAVEDAPGQPPEDTEQWETSGKKSKKKKKKDRFSMPWSEEPAAEPQPEPREPVVDEPAWDIPIDGVPAAAADTNVEPEPDSYAEAPLEPSQEREDAQSTGPIAAAEPQPEAPTEADPSDMWMAPAKSKKDKKKKKKQSFQMDDPWPEEAAPEAPTLEETTSAALDEAALTETQPAVSDAPDADSAVPEAELRPLSKKEKKKKQKQSLQLDESWPEEKATDELAPDESLSAGPNESSAPTDTPPAVPDALEADNAVPETEFKPLTKKEKKKKKQKSLQFDDPWPEEPAANAPAPEEPISSAPDDIGIAETQPTVPDVHDQTTADPDAEFKPLSKKDKKKKKKQSLQFDDPWPEEPAAHAPAPASEAQVTEEAQAEPSASWEHAAAVDSQTPLPDQPIHDIAEPEAEFKPLSKKDKKKKKQSLQFDDPWPEEPAADAPAPEEPVAEEAATIDSQPAVSDGPVQDVAEPEADFKPMSKKEKKKKKKQSLQFNDPWPEEQAAEAPVSDVAPAEQTAAPEEDISAKIEPTESAIPDENVADPEAEFSIIPKSKKQKKKDKKKSLQWEPEPEPDTFAALEPTQDERSTPLDQPDRETHHASDEVKVDTTTGEQEDSKFAEGESSKDVPQDWAEPEASFDPVPDELAGASEQVDSSHNTEGQTNTISGSSAPSESYLDEWDAAVAAPARDNDAAVADDWDSAAAFYDKTEREPLTDDWATAATPPSIDIEKDDSADATHAGLESEISEPLFTQGDEQVDSTRDAWDSFDPSQADSKAEDTPETDWFSAAPTKKGKKNKKKNRVSFQLPVEEPQTPEVAADLEHDGHVADSWSDAYAAEIPEPAMRPDNTSRPNEQQASDSEDEWARLISGKPKKLEVENEPMSKEFEEVVPANDESSLKEYAPAEEVSGVASDAPGPQEANPSDEWSQPTGKKGKKKKKRQSLLNSSWDDDAPTETVPGPEPAKSEPIPTAVDPEAEFEVLKKGKKNKKKKAAAFDWEPDLLAPDQEEGNATSENQEAQEPIVNAPDDTQAEPKAAGADEPEQTTFSEATDAPKHSQSVTGTLPNDEATQAVGGDSQPVDDTTQEGKTEDEPGESSAPVVEESDAFFPVKLSKKDKKKKKQASLDWAAETSTPTEKPADSENVVDDFMEGVRETSADQSPQANDDQLSGRGVEPTQDTTSATPEQPDDLQQGQKVNAEDEWGGFSLKKSKKDKKKNKKTKDAASAPIQESEPEPAHKTEPTIVPEAVSQTDAAPDQQDVLDRQDSVGDTISKQASLLETGLNEPDVEVPVETAADNLDDESWGFGLSKKEKKKKKKHAQALALENSTEQQPASSTAFEEEETVRFGVSDIKTEESATVSPPDPIDTPQDEEKNDDEAWGFGLSKKEKKKKKKLAKSVDLESSGETEIPVEVASDSMTQPVDDTPDIGETDGVVDAQSIAAVGDSNEPPDEIDADADAMGFGLSKKDKKKKKKQAKALGLESSAEPEHLQKHEAVQAGLGDDDDMSRDLGEMTGNALSEDAAARQQPTQAADGEEWGFGLSKKDKKKKKKQHLQVASHAETEPTVETSTEPAAGSFKEPRAEQPTESTEEPLADSWTDVPAEPVIADAGDPSLANDPQESKEETEESSKPLETGDDNTVADEWDSGLSKKEKKKKKKQAKLSEAQLPQEPEPRAEFENPDVEVAPTPENANDARPIQEPQVSEENLDESLAGPQPADVEAIDETWSWGMSKKDKKKKKKQAKALETTTPTEPQVELGREEDGTGPPPNIEDNDATPEPVVQEIQDETTSIPQLDEPEQTTEDFSGFGLSKKEKKKKKKQAKAGDLDNFFPEPERSQETEQTDSQQPEAQGISIEPTEEPQAEDKWSSGLSKKDKKKKKKSQALELDWDQAAGPSVEPNDPSFTPAVNMVAPISQEATGPDALATGYRLSSDDAALSGGREIDSQDTDASALPQDQMAIPPASEEAQPASVAALADPFEPLDEWDAPLSKKDKKKKKKSKALEVASWDDEAIQDQNESTVQPGAASLDTVEPSSVEPSATTETAESYTQSQAADVETQDSDTWSSGLSKKDKKKKKKANQVAKLASFFEGETSVDEPHKLSRVASEPDVSSDPREVTHDHPDSTTVTEASETVPEAVEQDAHPVAEQDATASATTEAPEDAWAFQASGKKGKKGKKKNRQSQAETLPWEESPESHERTDDAPTELPETAQMESAPEPGLKMSAEEYGNSVAEAAEAPIQPVADALPAPPEVVEDGSKLPAEQEGVDGAAGPDAVDTVVGGDSDMTTPYPEVALDTPGAVSTGGDVWDETGGEADAWEQPQRKLSKKDKKKLKKQGLLVQEETGPAMEPVVDAGEASKDKIRDGISTPLEPSYEEASVTAEDAPIEPDSWVPTKKSKKDKKKAQKLARAEEIESSTSSTWDTPEVSTDQAERPAAEEVHQEKTKAYIPTETITHHDPESGVPPIPELPLETAPTDSWADEVEAEEVGETLSQPVEQQASGSLDDGFDGFQSSKKKGKKGKKSKTPAGDTLMTGTTEPELQQQQDDANIETARSGYDAAATQVPSLELTNELENQEPDVKALGQAEEEGPWAFPVKKKKGKKGKKASISGDALAASTDIEPPQESLRSGGDIHQSIEEPDLKPAELEQPAPPPEEEDEWMLPAKKKGKKGKQAKSGSGTTTPTVDLGTELQAEGEPQERPAESAIEPDTSALQGEADQATPPEIQDAPLPAGEPDDEWTMPVKKKGKKGKKSKLGSGSMTPTSGLEPDRQPDSFESSAEPGPDSKALETKYDQFEDPEAHSTPVAPEPVADEWAMPTKKKGKKGKKSKTLSWSAFDEPEASAEVSSPAPEGDTTPQQFEDAYITPGLTSNEGMTEIEASAGNDKCATVVSNPDATSSASVEAQQGTGQGSITDGQQPKAETELEKTGTTGPSLTAPGEVEPDDMWSTPVPKKSKKDKKRKSKQVVSLEATDDHPPTETESSRPTDVNEPVQESMDTEGSAQLPGENELAVAAAGLETAVENFDGGFAVSQSKRKKKKVLKGLRHEPSARSLGDPWHHESPKGSAESSAEDSPIQGQHEQDTSGQLPDQARLNEATDDHAKGLPDNNSLDWDAEWKPSVKDHGSIAHETSFDGFGEKKATASIEKRDASFSDRFDAPTVDAWSAQTEEPRLEEPKDTSATAMGAAATGGVALLAEKFGGGKKKSKSKAKKKYVDKRQPSDDIFDDPAVWEGEEKRLVETTQRDGEDDGFWGCEDVEAAASQPMQSTSATVYENLTDSEAGWKETSRQGAQLAQEDVESPVLGKDDMEMVRSDPVGLLRRSSEVEEPASGLLMEEKQTPSLMEETSFHESEHRWSPSRGLPVVQEIPEVEAEVASGHDKWHTPDINRDSGFVTDSPNPLRRRSGLFEEEAQRDSGVHSGDWSEGAVVHAQTPDRPTEKRGFGTRSPFNTPVLREPDVPLATPEPEKKWAGSTPATPAPPTSTRGNKKRYDGLGVADSHSTTTTAGTGAAAGLAAGAVGAAAMGSMASRRSVSDNVASHQGRTGSGSGASPSPRAEAMGGAPRRSASNSSLRRQRTPEPLKLRPESPGITSRPTSTPTPPLRRVDKRMSGDLRALRQQNNSTPPVANEGRVRAKDMTDVYDGFGEGRIGSPRSPTRPHSMRRRQSMQVLELESRVEQLIAENRLLTEARHHAEQSVSQRSTSVLTERDAEIEALKQSLQYLQNEVARLTEVNEGLTSANVELANKDNSRHADLGVAHADVSRQLDEARGAHDSLNQSLEAKDAEIADLRAQLEDAKEQVRDMQRQILASKAGDAEFLNIRDEDYFDNRCQQLCSHAQQWVLRFSKFSDMRACRLTNELNDEKTIDRLDNAVLDGSDVDVYLRDRVKRRDIFMSMTMNMIWEFVFTRYLFGMDREQRQKLKSLEKLLNEVGPPQAVRQWRAVTLTLLSRRDNFKEQRESDTEAVVQAVFQTLSKILPPPGNLEEQIQSQLRRVVREAVDLSIEMRTQKAEYMMLPPLQPEYDSDGELAATVQFNASMMAERAGRSSLTSEELEAQGAVIRVVLFPLVVKRGDDSGVGDDEIVVCPAQVLVVREKGRRHVTPSSDAGGASLAAQSQLSLATEYMGQQPEAQYFDGGI